MKYKAQLILLVDTTNIVSNNILVFDGYDTVWKFIECFYFPTLCPMRKKIVLFQNRLTAIRRDSRFGDYDDDDDGIDLQSEIIVILFYYHNQLYWSCIMKSYILLLQNKYSIFM
jgi:hypothetical protein